MLYLKRKAGEKIVINDNIYVSVESIQDNYVKLGFEFPEDCKVLRKEVVDKVKQQNKQASENNNSGCESNSSEEA
jgi:carbon storage regulator